MASVLPCLAMYSFLFPHEDRKIAIIHHINHDHDHTGARPGFLALADASSIKRFHQEHIGIESESEWSSSAPYYGNWCDFLCCCCFVHEQESCTSEDDEQDFMSKHSRAVCNSPSPIHFQDLTASRKDSVNELQSTVERGMTGRWRRGSFEAVDPKRSPKKHRFSEPIYGTRKSFLENTGNCPSGGLQQGLYHKAVPIVAKRWTEYDSDMDSSMSYEDGYVCCYCCWIGVKNSETSSPSSSKRVGGG